MYIAITIKIFHAVKLQEVAYGQIQSLGDIEVNLLKLKQPT